MRRYLLLLAVMALAVGLLAAPSAAQDQSTIDRFDRNLQLPTSVEDMRLPTPLVSSGSVSLSTLDGALRDAHGSQQVVVQLSEAPAAKAASSKAVLNQLKKIEKQQKTFKGKALGLGAVELGSVQKALNAVMIEVDASALGELAALPDVVSIRPVTNYSLALSETVPYIGATAVQDLGFTGAGVRIAVLDSGTDYTHASLGGPGTVHAWDKAYGQVPQSQKNKHTTDRYLSELLFPTDVVVGGYDFVGEEWPSGPLSPDPDPIDYIGGHGTHVADIIHAVAPDAEIYSVKVCATFSTSCSGVALLEGMDFALDPNGDGEFDDHVDIVNMSLGSLYGQPFDDDLSLAVENASVQGVLSVTAAGNSADKPYVVDSPSGATSALSVAQTAVPSAVQPLMEVTAPAGIADLYPAVFQSWSVPLSETGLVEGPLQYGDGADGNLDGCAPFDPGSLTGKIVLVDRGACNFTLKISNISQADGLAGIIGLVAPGDPFDGGDGGDRPIDIPGFMVSQAISTTLKSGLPDTYVVFDPANGIPLVGTMVGSSARGPVIGYETIKPDIGAPGASVSAIAGTGTDTAAFGGTSGATPMVTGSAALLMNAFPSRSIAEIKSVLMDTAETDIMNTPAFFGGDLAPITRIGGGEVRVDRALDAPAAAWDSVDLTGSLSFRFHDVAEASLTLTRTVIVKNYAGTEITYDITPEFRFADDVANGAVSVTTPPSVTVPASGTAQFDVTMTIDGSLLRGWSMNSGSLGASGDTLTLMEYDGYVWLDDPTTEATDDLHVAWQVLPRKAAQVMPDRSTLDFTGGVDVIGLDNQGVGTAQDDAYSLVAIDENLASGGEGEGAPTPDIAAIGVNTYPVPAGYCSADESFIWAFAVNTHERQTLSVSPGIYWFDLDTDQDGTPDYAVFNYDLAGLGSITDGRNVTWAAPYVSYPDELGTQSAFFFTENATHTANTVLYICGEQVGLTGTDMLATNVDVKAYALDIYFGGPGDEVDPFTITPLGEQYFGLPADVPGNTNDPAGLTVYNFGPWPGNTPELGLMLFTNGDRGSGARGGATQDTEALFFTLSP